MSRWYFLSFILLGIYCGSYGNELMSSIKSGKIPAITSLNMASLLFFLFEVLTAFP